MDSVSRKAANQLPYVQQTFPPEEFQRRRERVAQAIGSGVALLRGSPASGAMDVFRQHNDFYYLCGVEVPHSYLLIDGSTASSTLFLPHQDAHQAEIEGPELNANDEETCKRLTGIDSTKPLSAMESELQRHSAFYLCHQLPEGRQACQDSLKDAMRQAKEDPWIPEYAGDQQFLRLLTERFGSCELRDLSPILNSLRKLKSAAEIDLMKKAGAITALAVAEAMRCTEPGMKESQLAAIAEYVFLVNGATGGSYRPIVASGDNIWNIHYYRNSSILDDGDLVLLDYAPDLDYYTSDIGRMWPVNGRFQPWQRELYGFVVDYHLTLLDLIAPGKTPREIREEARSKLHPLVSRTNWSSPRFSNAIEKLLATSRALTHNVGMAVHDQSGYQDDDYELEPGLVFALDPQLWVPEDRLYFRVEDTVVVTAGGVENFTSIVPHHPDEIEALMPEAGLVQLRRDLLLCNG